MNQKEIISSGILEAYVLGLCSTEELNIVEKAMLDDEAVTAELADIEKSLETYAMQQAIKPAVLQKTSIFKAIQSQSISSRMQPLPEVPQQESTPVISLWRKLAVAASILLIGSAITNIIFYKKYAAENIKFKDASTAYQKQQEDLFNTTARVEAMDNEMAIVQNKFSVPVALKGLEASPNAAAKIFWIKNTGEVYVASGNLPEAPQGKQYQLWGIVDGKPVDGGMIINGKTKASFQKMKSFGKAQAFAITLENTGGSETPKGDMYVMGTL